MHSRSVWRSSFEDKASGNLFVKALTVEHQLGRLRGDDTALQEVFCEDDPLGYDGPSRRQIGVGLALQCSGLPPLSGGFERFGDHAERSILAAFHLVQSVWGKPGLPGWGSVVDNTTMKGPIVLEELIFPPGVKRVLDIG